ncbi:MAG: hypothetical protein DI536_17790 [Archangium gephyra]|uniref:B box-type domain-containing protein n=1 Tax=Archangium gephyra TaxID=48 RepID=A0A2W5UQZ7_9BACT|nr:MAG: hypothetical protein DI536_17790 [Archangium gephyra]
MTARCALHFDVDAAGACKRCGRFACASCMPDGSFCAECAPLANDPYGLNRRLDHLAAAQLAFKLILADLPKLLVLVFVFSVPAALMQTALVPDGDDLKSISAANRVDNLYNFIFGAIGTQAMLAVLIARSEGRVIGIGRALSEGAMNWPRFFGARFRSGLWILLFALALLVPGVWQAVMLIFAGTAALRTRNVDPLEASRRLVKGRFWPVLGVGLMCGATIVAVIVPLGIVAIVDEEAQLPRFPMELVNELLTRFATDVVNAAVLLVAFVMLHRDADLPLEPMRWSGEPPPRQS